MTRARFPLAVIGGGPAGMAAAVEAASAGLACTLIDEARSVGGQVYRSFPAAFRVADGSSLGQEHAEGERLRAELRDVVDRVEIRSGTAVPGVWNRGRHILFAANDGSAASAIHTERVVIATGAYERPVPFPGWTLPGVMAAGGAHGFLRTMRVRPGRRALVAGTGPLIYRLAQRLHAAGVELAAVLDAASSLSSAAETLDRDLEGSDIRNCQEILRRTGVPIHFNHTLFEARAGRDGVVERALYGPVDPQGWRPNKIRVQTVDVDLVCVGFGFVPDTVLTTLAGCRHEYIEAAGGWVPMRDANMQTTVPGVFAAGDGAWIAGALAAEAEGRIAGITAAEQAGALSALEAETRRRAPRERLAALLAVSPSGVPIGSPLFRPGLVELATPETIICRCEEVALEEINAALDEGARDLQTVKLRTRLGMGPCQGRNCAPSTAAYMCRRMRLTAEEVGRINPRPPARPVTLGALAQMIDAGLEPNQAQAIPQFPNQKHEGVMRHEAGTR